MDTPSKRARFAAIAAGLQARDEDESPSQSRLQAVFQEESGALPFTHGGQQNQVASAPSPGSEADTDVDDLGSPPRYSFLGLDPSQGSAPSTPKKRPSIIAVVKSEHYGLRGGASSTLLTPPQSVRHNANRIEAFVPVVDGIGNSRPEPVTPTRHKGKERALPQLDSRVRRLSSLSWNHH